APLLQPRPRRLLREVPSGWEDSHPGPQALAEHDLTSRKQTLPARATWCRPLPSIPFLAHTATSSGRIIDSPRDDRSRRIAAGRIAPFGTALGSASKPPYTSCPIVQIGNLLAHRWMDPNGGASATGAAAKPRRIERRSTFADRKLVVSWPLSSRGDPIVGR